MKITERTFVLRTALKGEEEVLYDLIRELAVYEKKDVSKLLLKKENLVKFRDLYKVEFAECDGQVVGYALYFLTFSSNQGLPILYLEDIYVKEEYRRMGIGSAFVRQLAKYALEKECFRMDWLVFDWNESSLQFYKKLGSVFKDDLLPVRLEKAAMERLVHDEA